MFSLFGVSGHLLTSCVWYYRKLIDVDRGLYEPVGIHNVATLLWAKWEDETPTPEVEDLEFSETP
jgi:hypothetical protein